MLALDKDKHNRPVNPDTPNHAECALHPMPIWRVAFLVTVALSCHEKRQKNTGEKVYRVEDEQVKFHLRINWRPASPLDIVMLNMERERNSRLKP